MKPILIIGGGAAALGAIQVLRKAHIPHLVIERSERLGGRMSSVSGPGWVAETGCPYFKRSDEALMKVIREVGLDVQTVAVQDSILRLAPDGTWGPRPDAMGSDRVVLRDGMASVFSAYEKEAKVIRSATVGAVRWSVEEEVFILRDRVSGRTLRDPITDSPVEGAGLIVATAGAEAREILESSRALAPTAAFLKEVEYSPIFVGVYVIPRVEAEFYALEGFNHPRVEWIGFEERKVPGRIRDDLSVVVLRGSASLSEKLLAHDADNNEALEKLYAEGRKILNILPEKFDHAIGTRFQRGRPTKNHEIRVSDQGCPTIPEGLPFALAGDYTRGPRATLAVESGMAAALQVVGRLKAKTR